MVLKNNKVALGSGAAKICKYIGSRFAEGFDFVQAANPHPCNEHCFCQLKTHDQKHKEEPLFVKGSFAENKYFFPGTLCCTQAATKRNLI